MAIASAVPRGSSIAVYDERGRQILSLGGGRGPGNGLVGFTSSTVSVRRSSSIAVYDEKGCQIASILAG
jgi:hypothetical protein